METEKRLTALAKVALAGVIGPGLITIGAVVDSLSGMAILPTMCIVYGSFLTIAGVVALMCIGFTRDEWLKAPTEADLKKIIAHRDEKIGELYLLIDDLKDRLGEQSELLSLEKQTSQKLSEYILDERKTARPKRLKGKT